LCNSELRSIEQNLANFNQAGVRPVAISVDSPEDSRKLVQEAGYTFTFLSDQNREVIRRYDLVHADAGGKGIDISRPAEFLVDKTGTVRWMMLTENYWVRARPEEILEKTKLLQ
jgi:glutaredoxin-dependent peroxiredoxin